MEPEQHCHTVKVYLNQFSPESQHDVLQIDFLKRNTAEELIGMVLSRLEKNSINFPTASNRSNESAERKTEDFELCEVMGTLDGQACKERKVDKDEYPVAIQLWWPKSTPSPADDLASTNLTEYRFVLRRKGAKSAQHKSSSASAIDSFLAKFLLQPKDKEYPDLCLLPELTEETLLENLRDRFNSGHIYTYIGPILVAVNPFKFFPIYNPKYAKLYQNCRLGSLPPHIFALADATYHNMLRTKGLSINYVTLLFKLVDMSVRGRRR